MLLYGEECNSAAAVRVYAETYQQLQHPNRRKCIFRERCLREIGKMWPHMIYTGRRRSHRSADVEDILPVVEGSVVLPVAEGSVVPGGSPGGKTFPSDLWGCCMIMCSEYCMFELCNRRWIMDVEMISSNGYCRGMQRFQPFSTECLCRACKLTKIHVLFKKHDPNLSLQ
jgi:hypothetical protein